MMTSETIAEPIVRIARRPYVVALGTLTLGAVLACNDPSEVIAPGSIEIVVLPSGADVVTDDLRVTIGDTLTRDMDTLEVTVGGLSPGVYAVELEGTSSNCQITSTNPRSVTVESNRITVITFTISCTARVGSVRVTTTTTGPDVDSDGYTAQVIGGSSQGVGINETVTIPSVREGLRFVTLSGVASNCAIVGPDTAAVIVPLGGTVDASFSLECMAAGSLEVTVATTGVELDANGYLVVVDAPSVAYAADRTIEPNGSLTFSRLLPAADYRVSLAGIAVNCAVTGAQAQTATVIASATTHVAFDVACEAPAMLAFVRDGDIYVMSSDGTGVVRLTTDPAAGNDDPAWSSAGKIAFTTTRHSGDPELYVMNADGTSPIRITMSFGADQDASWSPDGQKLVFQSFRDVNAEIYVANADGSGVVRLTNSQAAEYQPAWSSSGKIAFVSDRDDPNGEIYVMDADGSNVVRLTNDSEVDGNPAWSPDGSMIAFTRVVECTYYSCNRDIFVMNADGSNVRRLATAYVTYQDHADPAWTPNGRAIAFTRYQCDYYYCYSPSLWVASVHEADVRAITNDGANPAFRP